MPPPPEVGNIHGKIRIIKVAYVSVTGVKRQLPSNTRKSAYICIVYKNAPSNKVTPLYPRLLNIKLYSTYRDNNFLEEPHSICLILSAALNTQSSFTVKLGQQVCCPLNRTCQYERKN